MFGQHRQDVLPGLPGPAEVLLAFATRRSLGTLAQAATPASLRHSQALALKPSLTPPPGPLRPRGHPLAGLLGDLLAGLLCMRRASPRPPPRTLLGACHLSEQPMGQYICLSHGMSSLLMHGSGSGMFYIRGRPSTAIGCARPVCGAAMRVGYNHTNCQCRGRIGWAPVSETITRTAGLPLNPRQEYMHGAHIHQCGGSAQIRLFGVPGVPTACSDQV
jgi:hypothetical protein